MAGVSPQPSIQWPSACCVFCEQFDAVVVPLGLGVFAAAEVCFEALHRARWNTSSSTDTRCPGSRKFLPHHPRGAVQARRPVARRGTSPGGQDGDCALRPCPRVDTGRRQVLKGLIGASRRLGRLRAGPRRCPGSSWRPAGGAHRKARPVRLLRPVCSCRDHSPGNPTCPTGPGCGSAT